MIRFGSKPPVMRLEAYAMYFGEAAYFDTHRSGTVRLRDPIGARRCLYLKLIGWCLRPNADITIRLDDQRSAIRGTQEVVIRIGTRVAGNVPR